MIYRTSTALPILALTLLCSLPLPAPGYPLDGAAESGIRRLSGDAQRTQPAGARLPTEAIVLRLLQQPHLDFDTTAEDAALSQGLAGLLKDRDPSYGLVLVDFSDPQNLRWAGLRPDLKQNPGSVGKIVCMLALFHALADAFPEPAERQRILRESSIQAGQWIIIDEHAVPHYDTSTQTNRQARLVPEDVFKLSEWIDHAVSASANGAGSVIWREAMLLTKFGSAYPLSFADAEQFFSKTPKSELAALARRVIEEPLRRAGLNTNALMQGSFWTRVSKSYVPGGQSYATPRELARYMLRMEQGRLVDPWSSLQMKKFLYVTKRRYRYAYAPELASSAVFFKSGSLYQCRDEEGFRCGKYMGNVRNMMNSLTTVERDAAAGPPLHYTAALMSNVLRVNSAWDHSRIAAAVHELLSSKQPVVLREEATGKELSEVGKSD